MQYTFNSLGCIDRSARTKKPRRCLSPPPWLSPSVPPVFLMETKTA